MQIRKKILQKERLAIPLQLAFLYGFYCGTFFSFLPLQIIKPVVGRLAAIKLARKAIILPGKSASCAIFCLKP